MPIVHYKFSLPKDKETYQIFLQAEAMHAVLWDLDQWLRSYTKYQEESAWPKADEVRTKLYEMLNEREVTLC
jgi:hypothetical protein